MTARRPTSTVLDVDSERGVADRARDDSRVEWLRFIDAVRAAKVMVVALFAVIAAIALADVLVASGALNVFG
jgi:hypothetical protein